MSCLSVWSLFFLPVSLGVLSPKDLCIQGKLVNLKCPHQMNVRVNVDCKCMSPSQGCQTHGPRAKTGPPEGTILIRAGIILKSVKITVIAIFIKM